MELATIFNPRTAHACFQEPPVGAAPHGAGLTIFNPYMRVFRNHLSEQHLMELAAIFNPHTCVFRNLLSEQPLMELA